VTQHLVGQSSPAITSAAAPEVAPSETAVTVMSFNIHHGRGTDDVLDLERIASVIGASGADIVGLQEVDRNFAERSDWTDQAAKLAELLNYHVAYGANLDFDPPAPGKPRTQFGNAVLSRYPITRWENIHLFRSPGVEQRGLLRVEVALPGAMFLHVYVTHLDAFSETDRVRQAQQVAELVDENCPAVLLGDFNARPEAPEIGSLRATLTDTWTAAAGGPPATHPADPPAARIDYIFISHRLRATWTSLSTDDPAASDHLPVVSRLALAGR
jgi:endonuclease/exonuclease/phosphatase family metal-dependent hydrolase